MVRYYKERFAKVFPERDSFNCVFSYIQTPIMYWLWGFSGENNIRRLLCRLENGLYAYIDLYENLDKKEGDDLYTIHSFIVSENLTDIINLFDDELYNLYIQQTNPLLSSFMAFPNYYKK